VLTQKTLTASKEKQKMQHLFLEVTHIN
jgi:hypothetical protein